MITTQTLVETSCCACGIVFAVPSEWLAARRLDGQGFCCPNKHNLTYGKTEIDRLREVIAVKDREVREAKCEALKQTHLRQFAESDKIKAQRKLKRASKGVCTCCNRTFQNLMAHMKTQHPEAK